MDIPAIAADAVNKAWLAAASALTLLNVRDVPTISRNATTEAETTTYGVSVTGISGLLYGETAEELKEGGEEVMAYDLPRRKASLLLRQSDLPGVTSLSTSAEIIIGSATWKVTDSQTPPGQAVFILSLRK